MSKVEASILEEELRDFHDAELVSVTLDRAAGRVGLLFSYVDGPQGRFECDGVLNIKCSTLLFQNVVLKISVTPVTTLDVEEIRELVASSFTLDNKIAISAEKLDARVNDVIKGKLKLLHVTPSWGAEVIVLCKSIALKPA
jgi:hypothetical protein